MQQSYTYRLLSELFQSLEAEGYQSGTGQYLRVMELLRKLPDDLPAEELKYSLAPLFVRNPQQQDQFYRLFDQSLARTERYFRSLEEEEGTAEQAEDEPRSQRWLRRGIYVLLALLIIPPLILFGWQKNTMQDEAIKKPFSLTAGGERLVCLNDSVLSARVGTVDTVVTIFPGSEEEKGTYLIKDNRCLEYITKTDTLSWQDSIVVEFRGESGDLTVHFLPIVELPEPEIDTDPGTEPEDEDDETEASPPLANRWASKALPYDYDLFAYAIEPPSWLQQQLVRYQQLLRLGGILLGLSLIIALLLYRLRRHRAPQLHQASDRPPYAWNIRISGVENIALGSAFRRLLNRMRQRTGSDVFELDVPGTIDTTIRKGGMVEFLYRQQTRPPEYLLLIDQQSRRNHRTRLFDYVFRRFRANEVLVERFFFDGDPRSCYNEVYPDGISLSELQQRYGQARLFVLGSGNSLINKMTGKLSGWGHILEGWKQRALFTPKPVEQWGRNERRLGDIFHLLPLNLGSLEVLLEAWEADEDPVMDSWIKRLQASLHPPVTLEGPLIATLQKHYSPGMMQWIAACAVFPSLHWHLTLYWGRYLSEGDTQLVTAEGIQQLCRLPWFVEGNMPEGARLQLVGWLEAEHPQLLEDIRKELVDILDEKAPPADSAAYEDYRMQAALNEYLVVSNPARRRDLANEISELMNLGNTPDAVVAYRLKNQKNTLADWMPDNWRDRFYRQGLPALGMESLWSELRWFVPALLLLIGLGSIPWNFQLGCQQTMVSMDRSGKETFLCVEDGNAWALLMEELARTSVDSLPLDEAMPRVSRVLATLSAPIAEDQLPRAFRTGEAQWRFYLPRAGEVISLGNSGQIIGREERIELSMLPFSDAEISVQEVRQRLSVALFNRGAAYALQAEAVSQDSALHDQACKYFTAAAALDTTFLDMQQLRDWCGAGSPLAFECRTLGQARTLYSRRDGLRQNSEGELMSIGEGSRVRLVQQGANYAWVVAEGVPGYIEISPGLLQPCSYLRGIVRSQGDNQRLADATVQLQDMEAKTGPRGQFAMEVNAGMSGTYNLTVFKGGYDTTVTQLTLPLLSPLVLYLSPEDTIGQRLLRLRVQVEHAETGKPLADVSVSTPAGKAFTGSTNESGETEIIIPVLSDVRSGGVNIVLDKPGFIRQQHFVRLNDLLEGKQQFYSMRPLPAMPEEEEELPASRRSRYLWVLDNPHGQNSRDKSSPLFDDGKTRLTEYELGRDLVERIAKQLEAREIEYYIVVPEEEDIPLNERADRINNYRTKLPKLAISFHFNKSSNEWVVDTPNGLEAWPKSDSEESARLAAILMESILRKTSLHSRSIKYSSNPNSFYLLRNVQSPVVLMENGFLNSRLDAARLLQPAFRQKLADAYVEAIQKIERQGLARTPAPYIEEKDSDRDGVDNRLDRCPFEPGKGKDGCPQEELPPDVRLRDVLLSAPTIWEQRSGLLPRQPYDEINTMMPDVGVRGRYYAFKTLVNPRVLQSIVGEPVYLSGPHSGSEIDFNSESSFGRYNPEFLRKLENYLATALQSQQLQQGLQGLYEREFQSVLRAFYDTYELGTNRPALEKQYLRLLDRIDSKGEDRYAVNRLFLQELPELVDLKYPEGMEKVMAARFWVRRSIDGTSDEFYSLLELVMQTFDPEYLASSGSRDKGSGVGRSKIRN